MSTTETRVKPHWKETTRSHPCPSCNRIGWCQTSDEGGELVVMCRRFGQPGAVERTDKLGVSFYLWWPDGRDGRGNASAVLTPPVGPAPRRAGPELLDLVYNILLAGLPLTRAHREALRARGLSDEAIDRARYRSLPGRERVRIAADLAERFGDALLTVPGFHINREGGREPFVSMSGAGPGVLVPVRDIEGRVVALLVRRDEPGDGPRYHYLSSRKRGGPGPGAPLHVPSGTPAKAEAVRVTEGALKADVACCLSDVPTLGVPGVGCWRSCIPALLDLDASDVLLAFDADWLDNWHVERALDEAARSLLWAGWRVGLELWEEPKGIDDLLAAGGSPEVNWLPEGGAL